MLSEGRFGDNLLRLAITVHLCTGQSSSWQARLLCWLQPSGFRPCRSRNASRLRFDIDVLWNLPRDGAQSFNQRLALCAIVDDECVVFAMR